MASVLLLVAGVTVAVGAAYLALVPSDAAELGSLSDVAAARSPSDPPLAYPPDFYGVPKTADIPTGK
ncbi:hypothetical protein HK405_006205, partial [Cladochytrium tenue]